MKLAKGLPNLRQPEFLEAWTRGVSRARDIGLRIQQFSIQSDHIHLIGESDDNESLERGITSLTGSVTWALRKIFGYHGKVFRSRYHLQAIKIPTMMRNAIKYVLFNNDHHTGVDRRGDEFSSIFAARGICREMRERILRQTPIWQSWIDDCLSKPSSWMQREGWRRARGRMKFDEVKF